jgi:hypothetical protein
MVAYALARRGLKQDDCEFENSLSYIVRPYLNIKALCLKV